MHWSTCGRGCLQKCEIEDLRRLHWSRGCDCEAETRNFLLVATTGAVTENLVLSWWKSGAASPPSAAYYSPRLMKAVSGFRGDAFFFFALECFSGIFLPLSAAPGSDGRPAETLTPPSHTFLEHAQHMESGNVCSSSVCQQCVTRLSLCPPPRSGDVIVYINDICVLGTTHADVVKLFQSVPIGQSVTLVLCRGYPLPFDPEDPSAAASTSLTPIGLEHRPLVVNGRTSYDPYLEYLSLSSQLPAQALAQAGAPHPGDTHLDGSSLPPTTPGSAPANTPHEDVTLTSSGTPGVAGVTAQGAEILTVTMVKGAEGFGFTIADSPTGQRVKQVSSLAVFPRLRL